MSGRLAFADIYGSGAAMGFTPSQVDEMSLWQFAVCVEGFNKSRGASEPLEPPTPEEFYDIVERLG